MVLQVCTNPQFTSPSAANGASVSTTGVAWTNSSWVEIAPTTDGNWILTGLATRCNDTDPIGTHTDTEFDIGIGAAGSEVVLTTIRVCGAAQGFVLPQQIRLMIPISGLTGRHAVRVRTSTTRVFTWVVALTYFKTPIVGTLLTSAQPIQTYPPTANAKLAVSSATPWNDVTWVEIVAATASAIVLTHLVFDLESSDRDGEIDIGVGAAGSEVVVATVSASTHGTFLAHGNYIEFSNPLDVFPVSSRIVFRPRCGSASKTFSAALMYQAKPL